MIILVNIEHLNQSSAQTYSNNERNIPVKKLISTLIALALVFTFAMTAQTSRFSAESYATANMVRIGGTDRFDTANRIAAQGWTTSQAVVLASAASYPDALAGAPLAYALDAPVLLVQGSKIDSRVMDQIQSLGATKIYILGGTAAVSEKIENDLKSRNYTVERIWGQNRYETAVEVAKSLSDIGGASSEAFIVSGENYPDALSVSPVAALKHAPIIYSNKAGKVNESSAKLLEKLGVRNAYVIGGTAAVGQDVNSALSACGVSDVRRVFGQTRYETSLNVAEYFQSVFTTRSIAFATGENYPDALAGGVFAAKKGMPVLLTNPKYNAEEGSSVFLQASAYDSTKTYAENIVRFIENFKPTEVFVFGGETVLPTYTIGTYFSGEDEMVSYTGVVYEETDGVPGDTLAGVTAVLSDITASSPVSIATVVSDESGKLDFGDTQLVAGKKYSIALSKDGYENVSYTIEPDGSKDTISQELRMKKRPAETGGVSGALTFPDGVATSSATVELYDANDKLYDTAESDSEGKYSFTDVKPGEYYISAETSEKLQKVEENTPVYAGKSERFTVKAGETVSVSVTMSPVKSYGSLSGTVCWEDDGKVISDAIVELFDEYGNMLGYVISDRSGKYSIGNVEPGMYYLGAYYQDESNISPAYKVKATAGRDVVTDLYVERADKTGTVSGKVTFNGETLRGSFVSVYKNKTDKYPMIDVSVDVTGQYSVTLEPGKYYIRAFYDRNEPTDVIKEVTVTSGKDVKVDFDIHEAQTTGTITGRVTYDGKALSGVTVKVCVPDSDYMDVVTTATTDSYGNYSVTVEEGSYDISVRYEEMEKSMSQDAVNVSAGGSKTCNFPMESGWGTLKARVELQGVLADESMSDVTFKLFKGHCTMDEVDDLTPDQYGKPNSDGSIELDIESGEEYSLLVMWTGSVDIGDDRTLVRSRGLAQNISVKSGGVINANFTLDKVTDKPQS